MPAFKKLLRYISAFLLLTLCASWGFYAHKQINRFAVFTLPSEMIGFYKRNMAFIVEHSVDPDKRRYTDPAEGTRHFLDTERYGSAPFDSIPLKWTDAVAKYSADTLNTYGTLPWQIEKTYYALVKAFRQCDSSRILHTSANLSHYIADAHVPLHVTQNYNGQLTGQTGIHSFWESRLPELFSINYNYFTGKASYIDNPLKASWAIIKGSHRYKDSVFIIEAALSKQFNPALKYAYSERRGVVLKQYSREYSKAFHQKLNGMVERQMTAAIRSIGSFWFSAWVDAGQPDLNKFKRGANKNQPIQEGATSGSHKKILGRPDL